jgi:Arc/MetJ-type ribon-helix-helix transcriptional regulator
MVGHQESVEAFVQRQIKSGRYQSREELIAAALLEMKQNEIPLEYLVAHMKDAAQELQNGFKGIELNPQTVINESLKRSQSVHKNGTNS